LYVAAVTVDQRGATTGVGQLDGQAPRGASISAVKTFT
jgi:hypothetical protein